MRHCRKFNAEKKIAEMWVWHENELTIVYTPLPPFLMPWNQHTIPFLFVLRPSFSDADPHPAPSSLRSYLLTWSPLYRPFCLDTWLSTSSIVKSQILIYCICMVCPVLQTTLRHTRQTAILRYSGDKKIFNHKRKNFGVRSKLRWFSLINRLYSNSISVHPGV